MMNDFSILLVGAFVTLLFLAGIVLSVFEFRKMDRRPEKYGAKGKYQPPSNRPG
jgi:hypothetical protein